MTRKVRSPQDARAASASAAEALADHYSACHTGQDAPAALSDGCAGVVPVGEVRVQFVVERLAASPEVYRVCFTQAGGDGPTVSPAAADAAYRIFDLARPSLPDVGSLLAPRGLA